MKREKPSYQQLQRENEQLRKLLSGKFAESGLQNESSVNFGNTLQRAPHPWEDSHHNQLQPPPFNDHWSLPLPEYRLLLKASLSIPGIPAMTGDKKESMQQELKSPLLNSLPFGVNVVNEDGTILFHSENMAPGMEEDVSDDKCWSVFCDHKIQCPACQLTEGIQVGKTTRFESGETAGGKIFQITQTGIMYKGQKALLEIFQDVTEKKEIKKKIKLLAHALESIQECVSIMDPNDRIIYVNESFRKTYGYSKEELIGRDIRMVRPEEMKHLKISDILTKTSEGGWRGEIMNIKKDGTLFPVLLSSSALKDEQGNLVAMIGVGMDITEMRQTRVELQLAKEQAEESNRLKTALLNNLSHEIRTPMNAIMGFSNLLPEATSEEKISYSGIIKKSAGHLLNMLDDVILISRLQSEKMPLNLTECQPAEMIGHVYRMFQHSDLNRGLSILMKVPEATNDLVIRADEDKIVQVLTNLVSNAVKYALKGSVEIGFSVVAGYVEFYVEDTGIGIQQKELNKIFENFYRGEQALKYAIRGHGLGLCITRELVELMGGTIEVTSEVNKGSRFFFTIPCNLSEARFKGKH